MSVYEELIPSYLTQKARGLKPRGRCAVCGRELALRADDTVGGHKRPDRQGRPSEDVCWGGKERSANLATDRVRPDLDVVEVKLLVKVIGLALKNSAFRLILDADQVAVLERALAKLNDPASRKTLTHTEEAEMFAALAAKED